MSFNPGFNYGLSSETQEKAMFELNENPESRDSKVQLLRDRIIFRPDLPFRRTDEKFLLRFLRARKFDEERAFDLLCRHVEFQKENPHYFHGLSILELRDVLQEGFPSVLSSTDRNGARVLVLFPGRWDNEQFSFQEIIKALILTMEELLKEEETQVNGVVAIIDFTGWSLKKHARFIGLTELRNVVRVFQDCFPARIKGIHLVRQPWYIHAIVKMCTTSILKIKTGNRLYLHGNNLMSLHNHIHPDLLPAELGGNLPEYDKASWFRTLITKSSFENTCETMAAVALQLTNLPTKV